MCEPCTGGELVSWVITKDFSSEQCEPNANWMPQQQSMRVEWPPEVGSVPWLGLAWWAIQGLFTKRAVLAPPLCGQSHLDLGHLPNLKHINLFIFVYIKCLEPVIKSVWNTEWGEVRLLLSCCLFLNLSFLFNYCNFVIWTNMKAVFFQRQLSDWSQFHDYM